MVRRNKVIEFFEQFTFLSKETKEAFLAISSPKTFAKKEYLLLQNDISDSYFFILKGCVREYFVNEKKHEVVVWFGFEDDIAVSLGSFAAQKPSITFIQALETTYTLETKRSDLYALYDKLHEAERVGRLLTEHYYTKIELYHYEFHHLSAGQRFENLIKTRPYIFQRVPLTMIASFLGITNETLSRLRARCL